MKALKYGLHFSIPFGYRSSEVFENMAFRSTFEYHLADNTAKA